ncbi:RNA-binding protein [Methylocella silvestris]|uniref:RNA-binding protein n=1 Tax=Methylocella silvestris TaxID=199596 RepID=A0A2J7TFH4_METSI|nr:RNA-binding protein [Methylocella silvestris]
MPTGPEGEKLPADVIGNAVKAMRIATGKEDLGPATGKTWLRENFGRKGKPKLAFDRSPTPRNRKKGR